jgi:hypothetical protein
LSRHRAHTAPSVPHTGSDPLEEAFRLVGRAASERERLRALEAVRAALELQLRDFARTRAAIKAPTAEQLAQLETNVRDAEAAYERVAGGSFDTAVRALQGLRSAVAALKAATARRLEDPIAVSLTTFQGDPVATLMLSASATMDTWGVPARYRTGGYRIRTTMTFSGSPIVEVFDGEDLVWKRRQPEVDVDPRLPPVDAQAPTATGMGRSSS